MTNIQESAKIRVSIARLHVAINKMRVTIAEHAATNIGLKTRVNAMVKATSRIYSRAAFLRNRQNEHSGDHGQHSVNDTMLINKANYDDAVEPSLVRRFFARTQRADVYSAGHY